MKLYGAIDLHSTNNVTVLIDEQDHVVYQKQLPNDLNSIVQQLSVYQSRMEGIVVESTYWYWLVDGLMEQGHRVHLAKLLIGQMTAEVSAHETVKFRLVRRNRRAYETFKS
jgi:transposase